MKPTLRTSTQIVCRSHLSSTGGWFPHVMQCIDDYLTGWLSHRVLTAACEAGASEHTLEYIFGKTAPKWKKAVKAAVRGGHVHVLHWMTGREDGRGPWKADLDYMLQLAASHGHLDVAKWFFERGIDSHTLRKIGEDSKGYIEKCWLYKYCTADALRLAVEHGHFDVVKWIYGIRTDTCSRDCSPMSQAVANGHLVIAQWLHSVKNDECFVYAMNTAAKNGHLEVLQWLDANHLFKCTRAAMEGAAENGHLEVVKWLHRAHHECCSHKAMGLAASNSHLEVAEWLYKNVYRKCHHSDADMPLYTTQAAGRGHLSVLKWTHEHFPYSFRSNAMDAAARNGHMDVITWLHENHNEGFSDIVYTRHCAAHNGHLEVLKWLYTHYPIAFELWLSDTTDRAAENGHLEIVRWLHENRPEGCTDRAVYLAASGGHLDILLYQLEHQTEGVSSNAMCDVQEIQVLCHFGPDVRGTRRSKRATSDQLKMLQTLFEQRPAFVRYCLRRLAYFACTRGNIEILEWVNQFGIELQSTKPIRDAVSRGDVKMLQWFSENGFEITDPDLLEVAVEYNQLEVARWLSEHGYAVNSLEMVKMAGGNNSIPTMRWLVEHGPPLDLLTATTLVLEYRHFAIVWWVAEKDRVQLALDALEKSDPHVLWWILVRMQIQDGNTQKIIRDAIQRSPKDIQQWIEDNLRRVEACRWCF